MSMKNDSKLVKYVFERDKDKLFLKYIKQTLIVGVLVIIVSVTVYFRDQYKGTWYKKWNIPILAYMLSCFLLCTYRCFSNMLNLIFMNDVELFLTMILSEKRLQVNWSLRKNVRIDNSKN